MPAKKTATGTSTPGRSRVTTALRKATGVVAKAAGRGSSSAVKDADQKVAAKKTAATKTAAKKSPATKATAAKAGAKKTVARTARSTKTAGAKTTAKKAAPQKAAATKISVKKAPATKAPAKKTTTAKTAAKKTATPPAKKSAAKAPVKKEQPAAKKAATVKATTKKTSQKTTAKKAVAKNTPAPTSSAPTTGAGDLRVRDDESPWTPKELEAVRAELEGDVERLTRELSGFEDDIAGLIKDSGDGAGDDQADTGAKTFEREHEASLAQNSRDLLEQSVHALERIDDGTYGVCENCGNAIGKLRLQAFPRATLCLNCKAQQERR